MVVSLNDRSEDMSELAQEVGTEKLPNINGKDFLVELIAASSLKLSDPKGFIDAKEAEGQKRIIELDDAGLILNNPELMLHIGPSDLPIEERLGVLAAHDILAKKLSREAKRVKGLPPLQQLPTDVYILPGEEGIIMTEHTSPQGKVERYSISDEILAERTDGRYNRVILGILAIYDLLIQSEEFRKGVGYSESICTGELGLYNFGLGFNHTTIPGRFGFGRTRREAAIGRNDSCRFGLGVLDWGVLSIMYSERPIRAIQKNTTN